MSSKKVLRFEGKEVDVVWDGNLCIHAEECWRSDSELFELKRNPFGEPDAVSVEEVDRISKRCPSGAIAWRNKSSELKEEAESENTVTVVPGGPLYVRGDVTIEGVAEQEGNVNRRVALCRCGHSKNQQFMTTPTPSKGGMTRVPLAGKVRGTRSLVGRCRFPLEKMAPCCCEAMCPSEQPVDACAGKVKKYPSVGVDYPNANPSATAATKGNLRLKGNPDPETSR